MKPSRTGRSDPIALYTTEEAARLMKLHPQTLKTWRTGRGDVELPFVKIGRAIRYRHVDINAFIQSHMFTNTREADE